MIILQTFLVLLQLVVFPFLAGCVFLPYLIERKCHHFSVITSFGMMILFACYEMFALFFIIIDGSFRKLTFIYACIALLFATAGMISAIFTMKKYTETIREWIQNKKENIKNFSIKKIDVFFLLGIILIGVQVFAMLYMATPDKDDAFYSGLSSMSISHDYVLKYNAYNGKMAVAISKRYAISALPVFQASLTLLSNGLHHLVISHNLFPLFYIPLAYSLYYFIACRMTKQVHQGSVLFFIALIHLFGNYFVFSPQNFLVTRIWQGKALFVCFGIPMLYLFISNALSEKHFKNMILGFCFVFVIIIACTFMGETGLFLAPVMFVALSLAEVTTRLTTR